MTDRDTSLLAGLDENPAFIETALSRKAFVECGACQRILAVSMTRELAEMAAMKGAGRKINDQEFRCPEHDHIEPAKSGRHS